MHNSIMMLFDEHEVIVNAIDVGKEAETLVGVNNRQYENVIRSLLVFFRSYGDAFHHQKEEAILFPEMSKKNELLADGVIKEMFSNHEEFREWILTIEKLLDKQEFVAVQKELEKYSEALLDHIAVENDEVFQMAETLFDESELERIFFRFNDSDRELGAEKKRELSERVSSLRKQLLHSE